MEQQDAPGPALGSSAMDVSLDGPWEAERSGGHLGAAPASGSNLSSLSKQASSDTYSGPVPTMGTPEDGGSFTIVPVARMNSASLAAAAAAAEQHEQAQQALALRSRRRLFFAQAAPDCSEEHLRAWFSQFGSVEQLQLHSEAPGCGHATMASHEAAAAALAALATSPQLPPQLGQLSASWALPADEQGGAAADGATAPPSSLAANADRTIFFAKVPPTALVSEVEVLFGSFGKLAEVNLFRAWAGAKHSKGCGLITYADRGAAGDAIEQLHGKYVFPGSDCPMVVEWMDLKKQRPVAPPPSADKPPAGCSCDAYKLLLSNIPITASECGLLNVLSQFGRVVQMGLAPDPPGVCAIGHVWYASRQSADALLARSKADPLWLRDTRTMQDLALAVKKARRAGQNGGSGAGSSSRFTVGLAVQGSTAALSSSSNNSSSYLPVLQLAGLPGATHLSAEQLAMHSGASAAATSSAAGLDQLGVLAASGGLPDVLRLLPMPALHNGGLVGGGAAGAGGMPLQQHGAAQRAGAYAVMAHDVCEAMIDYYNHDTSGLTLGMPVHLQPAMAAQMACTLRSSLPVMQQAHTSVANSQLCLPASMVSVNASGQHCLSSPANLQALPQALDEYEGSFNMSLARRTGSLQPQPPPQLVGRAGPLQPQLLAVAQAGGGVVWQQQPAPPPQQQQPVLVMSQPQVHAGMAAAQQMQLAAGGGRVGALPGGAQGPRVSLPGGAGGPFKSIAVPIEPFEVPVIAEHLSFFSHHSGAQVTITSLPGAGLAIMASGRPDQVALAQSLLATARGGPN